MTLATRRDYRVSMPYVKLDVGILDSTLWPDTTARSVFITALLMAQPREFSEPQKEIDLHSTRETGYEVPAGWYGYVAASGMGICNRALVDWDSNDPENYETGRCALAVLCGKDPDSRSNEFEGRRMLRVNGGYLVLNFMKYRDKDHTSADRSRRWRDRQRDTALRNGETRSETVERGRSLRVTHSDSDPKAEAKTKKRSKRITECAETADRSTPFLTFPCDGEPSTWVLTEAQIGRWCELFPSLAVSDECRKALAWIEASPSRRKTAGGMPKFLTGWLGRCNDSRRSTGTVGKTSNNEATTLNFMRQKGLL